MTLDIAASDLYDAATGNYDFRLEDRHFTADQFAALLIDWCEKYPILAIEDPGDDTDWETWAQINSAVGNKIQIIGDVYSDNYFFLERTSCRRTGTTSS